MTRRRRLVVEVNAPARNWSLPVVGLERIAAAAPAGWLVDVLDEVTAFHKDARHIVTPRALDAAPGRREVALPGHAVQRRRLHQLRRGHGGAHRRARGGRGAALPARLRRRDRAAAVHALGQVAVRRRARLAARTVRVLDPGDGMGGLGEALARRFRALGAARVTGVRRRLRRPIPPAFDAVISLDRLDEALGEGDVVVLAAPLTDETRGLLSAERLDRLPAGANVANVARGALLDEGALAYRLARGQIRGAVLDVFQEERRPAASPLRALRNALVTPHVSYVAPRLFWRRALDLFLDNWSRYAAGEPLRNVADKDAGY